jgi:predicted nucleic acid-binding protein
MKFIDSNILAYAFYKMNLRIVSYDKNFYGLEIKRVEE